jgi:hypothetical protein
MTKRGTELQKSKNAAYHGQFFRAKGITNGDVHLGTVESNHIPNLSKKPKGSGQAVLKDQVLDSIKDKNRPSL